jgi:uncharacterized membrane protein YkgB
LKEIVDYAPNRYRRGKRGYEEDHPLVKRLKITAYELTMIMSFLEEQGLFEYDKQEQNWINLTSKGFDVALQNQRAVNTERTNKASLFLSLVIALVAIANLLIGIPSPIEKWGVTIILSIAIIVAGRSIKKM